MIELNSRRFIFRTFNNTICQRRMICQEFLPTVFLQQYIKCYHLRHFIFSDTANIPYKPYAARPEQTLAFYPRGSEWVEYPEQGQVLQRPRSVIIGQHVQRTNRHLKGGEFCVLIVNFKPGVLYRLTGLPFSELTNRFIDGEAIFGKEMRRTNDRLGSANNHLEMIAIVEHFLMEIMARIKKDEHPVDIITEQLLLHPGKLSLPPLARQSFLSSRQFERKFKERMGVSPRLFARIARTHQALKLKYRRPTEDWLSIAIDCGYHDYQHLVKDFQAFAGVTPSLYYANELKSPEQLFGLQDSSL